MRPSLQRRHKHPPGTRGEIIPYIESTLQLIEQATKTIPPKLPEHLDLQTRVHLSNASFALLKALAMIQ
jgi:hypothetical protein